LRKRMLMCMDSTDTTALVYGMNSVIILITSVFYPLDSTVSSHLLCDKRPPPPTHTHTRNCIYRITVL
jgi:hypothetical protein